MDNRAPTHDVIHSASHRHHEDSEQSKILRSCFLQHRTELEFWSAIDRLADYGQKHELLLQRIINDQWKMYALIAFSIGLQILHMSAQ